MALWGSGYYKQQQRKDLSLKSVSPKRKTAQFQPYCVCKSCGQWLYTHKVPVDNKCTCGGSFKGGRASPEPGDHPWSSKRQKHSSEKEGPWNKQPDFLKCMELFVTAMPELQREKFKSEFPELSGGDKAVSNSHAALSKTMAASARSSTALGGTFGLASRATRPTSVTRSTPPWPLATTAAVARAAEANATPARPPGR